MPDRRSILLVLATSLLLPGAAWTTSLAPLSLEQLTAAARVVARARCLGNYSRWENGEIWTDTTFRVLSHNKGYLPEEIVVRQPGGKFQRLHSHVEGAPEFRPGEEVYLFLSAHPSGQFLIVGWAQGTFRIRRDLRSGGETVTQDSAETPVFDPASSSFTKSGVKNLSIDVFEQRIQRAISRETE